jgi:Holliday junction resolvase
VPNRSYQKGARAEYIVRDALRAGGWLVMRSYASKGAFDLLAIAAGCRPMLVSVKGWGARMSPAEREALVALARQYGAVPLSAHYQDGSITWADLWTGEPWSLSPTS